jgi:RNA recognition motif-containing protein
MIHFNISGDARPAEAAPTNRQVYDTVMVRNLPHDLDWQELRDFFSTCGDVKNAMIKERGVGLVRFTNERAAEHALSKYFMNTMCNVIMDIVISQIIYSLLGSLVFRPVNQMGSWLGHWKIDFRPMLSSFAYQINNLV